MKIFLTSICFTIFFGSNFAQNNSQIITSIPKNSFSLYISNKVINKKQIVSTDDFYSKSSYHPDYNIYKNAIIPQISKAKTNFEFIRYSSPQIIKNSNLIGYNIEKTIDNSFFQEFYFFSYNAIKKLDNNTEFEIDWFFVFEKESNKHATSFEHTIYFKSDTIVSLGQVGRYQGISADKNIYRLSGKTIDSIQVNTKLIFNLYQGFNFSENDPWTEFICQLESEEINSKISKNEYQIPSLSNFHFQNNTFQEIKKKAITIQRKFLIEKKDSLINSDIESRDYYIYSINSIKKKLKPKFEDAQTLEDLQLVFTFNYYSNDIKVFYKDGSTKNFKHYIFFIPKTIEGFR